MQSYRPKPQKRSTQSPRGVLNFRAVNRMIEGRVGYQGATGEDVAISYCGEKPSGNGSGSDIGHKVLMDGEQYIVKVGVTLSLFARALGKHVAGLPDKEKLFMGFIVGNFTRIAGGEQKDHPELIKKLTAIHGDISQKKLAALLTDELLAALNQFKTTDAGKAMLEKIKSVANTYDSYKILNTNDIHTIFHYIVSQNEILRDVVGLAAFSDLVNGACGQFFNNAYQERQIPRDLLDDHNLLIEQNNRPAMYMASRFIANAEPFDKFLLEPFLDKNNPSDDEKAWLEKCKQVLSAKLTHLHGLGAAIFVRFLMGEATDLGPDNMLIANHNGAQHIINIDVTGFRYPRRNTFEDTKKKEVRLGWENVLKSNDPEEIRKALFDKTVFDSRFISEIDAIKNKTGVIMKTILEVLISKIDLSELYAEVQDVRSWLQSQSLEGAVSSLKDAMNDAYTNLKNPVIKPQLFYLHKLVDHSLSFIRDSIEVAQKVQQAPKATADFA